MSAPKAPGSGWPIVQDVLDAYGWVLHLDHSELGGLKVSCFGKTHSGSEASPGWGISDAHPWDGVSRRAMAGCLVSVTANSRISAR